MKQVWEDGRSSCFSDVPLQIRAALQKPLEPGQCIKIQLQAQIVMGSLPASKGTGQKCQLAALPAGSGPGPWVQTKRRLHLGEVTLSLK